MEVRTYVEEITKLREADSFLEQVIPTIEDLKDSNLLEKVYHEFQLIREAEQLFTFSNTFLAFSWNKGIYAARAQPHMGNYLMLFNPVFVKSFHNSFNDNSKVLDYLNGYVKTEKAKKFLTTDGLTWLLNRILFYHEHAHVIQFSHNQYNSPDSHFQVQVLEADADIYSSYCLASHVFSNTFPAEGNDINLRELVELLVLTFSASFTFIISLVEEIEDFYTDGKKHPHPIIRALIISNSLFEYFNICTKEHVKDYYLKENEFWRISVGVAQGIIEILYPDNINLKLADTFDHNLTEILSHYKKLYIGVHKLKFSAIIERNRKLSEYKSGLSS